MTLSRAADTILKQGEETMRSALLAIGCFALGISGCAAIGAEPDPRLGRTLVDNAIDEPVARGAFPFLYARVEKLDGRVVYEHDAIHA